jgi:hypothetical protein
MDKVIPVEDAIALIQDGDTVAATGYGGNGIPDDLYVELERRFLDTGTPRDLTLLYPAGQGDSGERGLTRLAHEGLLRRVIGGHFALIPRLERLILANRIEAYNLPEGVLTHLFRDIAAGKPGTLSGIGSAPSSIRARMAARPTKSPRKNSSNWSPWLAVRRCSTEPFRSMWRSSAALRPMPTATSRWKGNRSAWAHCRSPWRHATPAGW